MQTKISLRTPIDFFEWSPLHKEDLGIIKDMFLELQCWSVLFFHLALIVFIFSLLGICLF